MLHARNAAILRGKRFRCFKRADKTCDNIKQWSLRRVKNAVHLTGSDAMALPRQLRRWLSPLLE